MNESPTITDMHIEIAAMWAHEINRTYCEELLGDRSQVPWIIAPEWQRESSYAGVRGIISGAVTVPKQSHDGWLAIKREAGWKYGPVKDVEKKEHPCFVPYEELPQEQKLKDTLFFVVVKAIMTKLDPHCLRQAPVKEDRE